MNPITIGSTVWAQNSRTGADGFFCHHRFCRSLSIIGIDGVFAAFFPSSLSMSSISPSLYNVIWEWFLLKDYQIYQKESEPMVLDALKKIKNEILQMNLTFRRDKGFSNTVLDMTNTTLRSIKLVGTSLLFFKLIEKHKEEFVTHLLCKRLNLLYLFSSLLTHLEKIRNN